MKGLVWGKLGTYRLYWAFWSLTKIRYDKSFFIFLTRNPVGADHRTRITRLKISHRSIMSRTFFSGQLTSVLGLNTKLGTTSKKETEQNIVNFFCVTKKNLRGANAGCLRPFTTRARVRTRLWSLGGVQKSSASEGFIGRKNFWQSETKASARAPEVVRPPKATRVRENSIRPSVSCPRGFVGMRPVCRHRLCRDARAFSKNP